MVDKFSLSLSILICLFAIGSWISLNGLWVELPLLVHRLPEGWQLPTYVVTIIQLANIAPIIYMAIHYSGKFHRLERFTIYLILSIGCVCCALLSYFWSHTVTIFIFNKWQQLSIAFFILILILSIVDTTSSVTFLPYLVNYPRQFITALYIGEGLSGFLPGIAGLIQGAGGDPLCINHTTVINGTNHTDRVISYPPPRFSIFGFFLLLCVILILCLVSFCVVDNCKHFRTYQIETKSGEDVDSLKSTDLLISNGLRHPNSEIETLMPSELQYTAKRKSIMFILLIGYINFFTNGLLPSIQNYSLMPYSVNLYHLVVTISQMLNPLACLLTIYKWKIRPSAIVIMTTLASIGTAYIIYLAYKSPVAILNNSIVGEVLAAFSWFAVSTIFSFEKALLAIELQKQGHIWLQWCGASTQIGSTIGAVLAFVLVAIVGVFQSKQIVC